MAGVYGDLNRENDAIMTYQRAISTCETFYTPYHIDLAIYCFCFARFFNEHSQFEKATQYFKRCIEIREKLGENAELAEAMNFQGLNYLELKQYNEAEPCFKRSLEVYENINIKDCFVVAEVYNNLAVVKNRQKNHNEAIAFENKAIEIGEKFIGNDRRALYYYMSNLMGVFKDIGNHEEAQKLLEKIPIEYRPKT